MTPAVSFKLHPDLEALTKALEALTKARETPRAPGFANAGVMLGLLPGHAPAHLRDAAKWLLDRAAQEDAR